MFNLHVTCLKLHRVKEFMAEPILKGAKQKVLKIISTSTDYILGHCGS